MKREKKISNFWRPLISSEGKGKEKEKSACIFEICAICYSFFFPFLKLFPFFRICVGGKRSFDYVDVLRFLSRENGWKKGQKWSKAIEWEWVFCLVNSESWWLVLKMIENQTETFEMTKNCGQQVWKYHESKSEIIFRRYYVRGKKAPGNEKPGIFEHESWSA